MAVILPTFLVDSKEEFESRLGQLPESVDTVSVDVMDGTFVEPTTWHNAEELKGLVTHTMFELDLMVDDPMPIIKEWARLPNTIRAVVHAELDTDMRELIRDIKTLGLEAGIALLPKTSMADVEHLLNEVDMVMVRGNEPGYSGREFDPAMYKKIEELHNNYPDLMINVDIGVNASNVQDLSNHGATHLCTNSAIFKTERPAEAYAHLKELASA